ncbi:MAG: potassium channel family protein [Pseudomonadota bacterium]
MTGPGAHASIWHQILLGSLVLGLCAVVHIMVLVIGLQALEAIDELARGPPVPIERVIMIASAFGFVLLGHTLQVWIWAISFYFKGSIATINDAVYFALVTTTTLGYGDITLPRGQRIFGAMGAVSGLLTFGLSTAFLVSLMEAILKV